MSRKERGATRHDAAPVSQTARLEAAEPESKRRAGKSKPVDEPEGDVLADQQSGRSRKRIANSPRDGAGRQTASSCTGGSAGNGSSGQQSRLAALSPLDRDTRASTSIGNPRRRVRRWVRLPRGAWFQGTWFQGRRSALIGSLILHVLLLFLLAGLSVSAPSSSEKVLLTVDTGLSEPELFVETPSVRLPPEPPLPVEQSVELSEPLPAPAIESFTVPSSAVRAGTEGSIAQSVLNDFPRNDPSELLEELPKPPPRKRIRSRVSFFGLQSPANRVCFVVDSSRSMRGGRFDIARREVVLAISRLAPTQQFFVILFDQNLDCMVLEGPEPERRPAAATDENRQRLIRWLANAQLETSGNPTPAIELALSLQPDIIFLLTDGELPAELLTYLRRRNQAPSEDGTKLGRVAVIHTIGLHSRRGAPLLLQIARENGGQYRFIPKPPKP